MAGIRFTGIEGSTVSLIDTILPVKWARLLVHVRYSYSKYSSAAAE